MTSRTDDALGLLDLHFEAFFGAAPHASATGHPVPMDTRGWSQILVSMLTGIRGADRKKGADLIDGSDVKAANTWEAIDFPRFNGVLKAGTKSSTAGLLASLDEVPNLYFVLWDKTPRHTYRCRVWVVATQVDIEFRRMAATWFAKRHRGEIISNNFQLHPPRGRDEDIFRNTCGNLLYPLYFLAERTENSGYFLKQFSRDAPTRGRCILA